MKIGILTFHFAHNYGAMLQSYALSTVLRMHGYDAEIIDYRVSYIYDIYERFSFKGLYDFYLRHGENKLIATLKSIKNYRKKRHKDQKWYKFENFLTNILVKSIRIYTIDTINKMSYDVLFFGSDQIWNDSLTGNLDPCYFGVGLKKSIKKISYAASTGHNTISVDKWNVFSEYIKNLDIISVREEGFSEYLSQHLVSNCLVADPIFLLNESDWDEIAIVPNQNDYILTYSFSEGPLFFENAYRFSKKLQKGLVCITYKKMDLPSDVIQINNCGPQEFLGFFKNSDIVLTNSFHGTAFSILYNKQFVCVAPQKRRERVESLVKRFGLVDCLIEENDVFDDIPTIDYHSVNLILSQYRKNSLNFIFNSLES
jgi:hypothetical protein